MRHQRTKRLPNWAIGLILVVVLVIGSVYAYTKELPWSSKYEVDAVFTTAANVRPDSPVRIAGVNVGKVTSVEHLASGDEALVDEEATEGEDEATPPTATVVTMELDESALPLHTDATMKLRPRLFLEGNLFVDLKPGSPNAPEADDGYVFPANQTQVAVQLDQVLTTLQADVRTDLQILLDEFGAALDKHGGSKGLRELFRSSPGAFRYTSQVNEALLGTEPRDLSDLVVNLDSTVEALGRNETELQDLVTNLHTVLGSFAAESDALEEGIALLPQVLEEGEPALASLNASFPAVRAFAREALPGVRSTPAMLDATTPFLHQLRGLVSEQELGGLVADLRPAIPSLTRMTRRTTALLRDEVRPLASCVNEVLVPWSQDIVPDDDNQTINGDGSEAKLYEETDYAVEGLSGFSRSGDANGPYARVLGASGPNIFSIPATDRLASTAVPLLGVLPTIDSSAKAPFRPNAACEAQDPPNLASELGAPLTPTSAGASQALSFTPEMEESATEIAKAFERAEQLSRSGNRKQARKGADLVDDSLAALGKALRPALGGGEGG